MHSELAAGIGCLDRYPHKSMIGFLYGKWMILIIYQRWIVLGQSTAFVQIRLALAIDTNHTIPLRM